MQLFHTKEKRKAPYLEHRRTIRLAQRLFSLKLLWAVFTPENVLVGWAAICSLKNLVTDTRMNLKDVGGIYSEFYHREPILLGLPDKFTRFMPPIDPGNRAIRQSPWIGACSDSPIPANKITTPPIKVSYEWYIHLGGSRFGRKKSRVPIYLCLEILLTSTLNPRDEGCIMSRCCMDSRLLPLSDPVIHLGTLASVATKLML